ncbi:MAG: HAD family hydrolase [Anaerostipes sp.]|nr:HAD family hydrolase [Anaerostipes sp.]MDD4371688.1 HAD family hydrolase [Anaerostipes sp.]
MKYKAIIFDMDGTILNTLDDLKDSLNVVLKKNQYPLRSIEEVRSFVGNGIQKLIERAVPEGISQDALNRVCMEFKAYYQEHCAIKTKPYDGIVELLKELREKGYLTAVVSNKADDAVQDLCKEYFPGLFHCALGEKEEIRKKPAPDSVFATLKELKVEAKDAIYIGDSEVDFQTSQNAKLDHIIVRWGFRDEDFLREQGATVFVSQPEEILKLL